MRGPRRPRRQRKAWFNPDPVERYAALARLAAPGSGAAEGERRNALAAMAKMEAKYGKEALITQPEAKWTPADDFRWEDELDAMQAQYEAPYAARPYAKPGEGFHVYHEGMDASGMAFVPMAEALRVYALDEGYTLRGPDEAAELIVSEIWGSQSAWAWEPGGRNVEYEKEMARQEAEREAFEAWEREAFEAWAANNPRWRR